MIYNISIYAIEYELYLLRVFLFVGGQRSFAWLRTAHNYVEIAWLRTAQITSQKPCAITPSPR